MISAPLSEVADVIRGVSFSKNEGDSLPSKGRLPIIRAGSIQDTLLLNEGLIWVPEEKIKNHQKIRCDDIIMCTSSGSADLVGKCAKSSIDFEGSFGAFCAGIRPNSKKVSASYLYHFLISPSFRNWTKVSSGANIKNIRISELAEFEIRLPSLAEQHHAADILDKANAMRRKRQQAILLADEFLQSIFLNMFGDPVANPKDWSIVELGSVLETIESGTSPKCDSRQPEVGEWGVLKLGAVTYCKYNPAESKAMFLGDTPNKKDEVHAGDLLFTRKNTYDLVGASAIVESTPPNLLMPDLIFRLQTKKLINKYYLWALLTNPGMRARVQSLASGAAGSMPNISKQSLKGLKIPLPPIDLQYTYQDIHMKTGSIKRKFEMASAHFLSLSNALSYKAFSGEL